MQASGHVVRRACGTALVIALVAGCASPADRRAALEKEAETTLASSAWIVSRARALHDQGAATSPYVRVVARQNADDVRTRLRGRLRQLVRRRVAAYRVPWASIAEVGSEIVVDARPPRWR